MGARGAVTPVGQALTQVAGLVAGYGIRDNIEEAYTWLSRQYQPDDQIYVFGFSRGAYTARALTGMVRTVGLLRPGTENLVPYALKLYAQSGRSKTDPHSPPDPAAKEAEQQFWRLRADFGVQFGNPAFPNPFEQNREQVHFLGVWDTVKSVGWLNLKARIEMAQWPFTRRITNVGTARHAMAIDERRRPYAEYRFDEDAVTNSGGRYREMWFAGVHSDVGGQFPDHQLSDIAFSWMVREANGAGLVVNGARYGKLLGVGIDQELPAERALGTIHPASKTWALAGGWRQRPIRPTDALHPSVLHRIEMTKDSANPYRPDLARRAITPAP